MDFDFRHIAVPFRMQPGLQRMAPGAAHVTPLDPHSALYTEKLRVQRAGQAQLCMPGFDPGPAMAAIGSGNGTPELEFEEDFAVLDTSSGVIPWLCVCVPSHWAPEDKLGQSLASIHAPVADGAALTAAMPALSRLLAGGGHWERFVWTITPSGRYDQHPHRYPRAPWPQTSDPGDFAAQCYLRVERQTFLPVPGHRQVVFTIRVMLNPMAQGVQTPQQARHLHDALASMTPAVLAYKQLATARAPLLSWLAWLAAGR
jgi:hypothetical protein